jgi:membrane-bound metal-dependent hydrolase YbcI (DUF457 family)
MFLGHYGVAFACKRLSPRTSLGTFTFAAQFLDELWPILLILGVEHVRIDPGYMAANPLAFTSYPFSHSLATALLWGVLIGVVYLLKRRDGRGATLVGAAVVSHWILDVPMHAPDLPLWPGSPIKIGFGLWNSVPATIVIELVCFFAGLWMYLRATRSRDRTGNWALWMLVAVLLAIYISGFVSPPPSSERAVGWTALVLWLFIPWAAWADRHREVVPQSRP